MKRLISILLIIVLLSSLFVFTGCNKVEEKQEPKSENEVEINTLEYLDSNSGNKVTFKYLPEEKYEIEDTEEGGKFLRINLNNEDLNLEISMYLVEDDYEYDKEANKDSDDFKEYKAGNHEGFMYTESNGLTIQNKILLVPGTEEDYALSMYMYIEKLDESNETSLVESFNSESFQRFLSSIEYEKVN